MCSGNEGQAKIMATNMPRKDPGRSRRSGRVWKRRLQGGKVQESHGERAIKEPSGPHDISVCLILLVSDVSVAVVIGLIRCCIAVFTCCPNFCGSWSSAQGSPGNFSFVGWWGTCRAASPALPSVAAILPCSVATLVQL